MALSLDLASSSAKVARAREQLNTLNREIPAAFEKTRPYAIRVGEVDPDTDRCSIFAVPQEIPGEHRLSAIAGEVHHNLRCALDYIVTALVQASKIDLTGQQFPIFKSAGKYKREVAEGSSPVERGQLSEIKYGLAEIEAIQPYHTQPDPESDPLWHLHRFSNADKHREIAVFAPIPGPGKMNITGGQIVEVWTPRRPPDWEKDREIEIGRVRFAKPYPSQIQVDGDISVIPMFGVGPLKKEPKGIMHDLPFLEGIHDRVRLIVETFAAL